MRTRRGKNRIKSSVMPTKAQKNILPGVREFGGGLSPLVQAKLNIGQPNDKYEREADFVADKVMRMPANSTEVKPATRGTGVIQRTCASCSNEYSAAQEEDREVKQENLCPKCQVQAKPVAGQISSLVQRSAEAEQQKDDEDENNFLQTQANSGQAATASPSVSAGIKAMQGGGQALSAETRAFMEPRFGHDFSNVRVHTDRNAGNTSKNINAQAFTVGKDIAFAPGRYRPDTRRGKKLLAHELTHVVQQGESSSHSGRVQRKVTVQSPGKKIPKPGGKGLDQTNADTVQNYLQKLCKSGSPKVSSSGDVAIGKGFCSPIEVPIPFAGSVEIPAPATWSKTPTGCGCLCDLVHSKHSWKIMVDDSSWPHTVFDDHNAANGKTPGGTGGIVTTPSPNSEKLWGTATTKGKTLDIDPWLVLGHELCGHGWLGNFGKHGPDRTKPRGEGGHQETVKRENMLRAEHGIDLRGSYKDPYCGESYWRSKKKPKKVNWSSYLDVCKKWRKKYNKKHKAKYKLGDKIP